MVRPSFDLVDYGGPLVEERLYSVGVDASLHPSMTVVHSVTDRCPSPRLTRQACDLAHVVKRELEDSSGFVAVTCYILNEYLPGMSVWSAARRLAIAIGQDTHLFAADREHAHCFYFCKQSCIAEALVQAGMNPSIRTRVEDAALRIRTGSKVLVLADGSVRDG